MAFMVKDGFRLYYEDTGGNAPSDAVPARRGRQSPELVAAGAGVRRGVPLHHRRPARLRPIAGRGRWAGSRRARDRRARAARSSGDRARRASSRSRWEAGRRWARPCARRSDSGRSSWPTPSATSPNPEIAAVRQRLAAASPPRPAVLWHAALGPTFRKRSTRSSLSSTRRSPATNRAAARRFQRSARPPDHAGRALRRHPGADACS